MDEWDVYQTNEVAEWLAQLQDEDPKTADLVDDAIYEIYLKERGGEERKQ